MDDGKKRASGLFSYLDIPKVVGTKQAAESVAMVLDFMKYQAEVAYETGKKQAIALTSTASTLGIGWSAIFFGIAQESWLTSSIGMMMVFAATFLLGYWTPHVLDKARKGLDEVGAAKFYSKWLSERAGSDQTGKS